METEEGDGEKGALGTWMDGAPQWGGTRDRGTERSVQRDAPARGEEQRGVPEDRVSPRTECPCHLGGGLEGGRKLCPGSDRGHPDVPALLQPPAPQPQEWLWAVSPTVSPCPCHPVPYTCPCVPTSPPACPYTRTCIPVPHARPHATPSPAPHVSLCRWLHAPCLSLKSPSTRCPQTQLWGPCVVPPLATGRRQEDTEGRWGPVGAAPMGGSAPHGPPGTHRKPHPRPAVWRPTWWDRAGDKGDSQGRGGRDTPIHPDPLQVGMGRGFPPAKTSQ